MELSIVMACNWPVYDLYKEFLTPADAWNVDKKMDDGYPETGVIYAHGTAPELCNKNAPAGFGKGDNEYVLDSDEEACNLVYWLK